MDFTWTVLLKIIGLNFEVMKEINQKAVLERQGNKIIFG